VGARELKRQLAASVAGQRARTVQKKYRTAAFAHFPVDNSGMAYPTYKKRKGRPYSSVRACTPLSREFFKVTD
jgi:hypothetical protein